MQKFDLLPAVLSVLIAGVMTAHSAINPQEFRKRHPECILIKVTHREVDTEQQPPAVLLEAEVVEIFYSATGLKAGDIISIAYKQHVEKPEKKGFLQRLFPERVMVGPQPLYSPKVLTQGDIRVAHLALEGDVYTPQAYQYSFETENEGHKYRQ